MDTVVEFTEISKFMVLDASKVSIYMSVCLTDCHDSVGMPPRKNLQNRV